MPATITVYQNYYKAEQREVLDPAFVPHDWRHNPFPEYREVAVFLKLYETGEYKESDYTGIVSAKFGAKTKIRGREFIEFIERNPGHDVYFINPFPQNAYHSFNVWEHGEAYHPGITLLAQELLDQAGYRIRLAELGRNKHDTLLYCNYWVGNTKFWESYIPFILQLHRHVTEEMAGNDKEKYFALTQHITQTPILPFIFERLFSTYLQLNRGISGKAYDHTDDEVRMACLHQNEWDIVRYFKRVIDEWDAKGVYGPQERAVFAGLLKLAHNYNVLKTKHEGPLYE
ncbi:hypothetical protein [Candidatus Nitrospira bockiana]